jgi:hypothetical protein
MSSATEPKPEQRERRAVCLGHYNLGGDMGRRELRTVPASHGRTLVIDWTARRHEDARLLADLSPDEGLEHARAVAEMYLADDTRGRCRPLASGDLVALVAASSRLSASAGAEAVACKQEPPRDAAGCCYRLREVCEDGRRPSVRWTRSGSQAQVQDFELVTLREVVGRLESYEPARMMTVNALEAHRDDHRVSTCQLGEELSRLLGSPIVLNRGLREAVDRCVRHGDTSLSEIALRCGRSRPASRSALCGETSWLARKIGQMPDSATGKLTPWIHTDTLALIARDGLCLSPHEVELG